MKRTIAIIANLFIAIMGYAAWIYMAFFTKDVEGLTSSGLTSLKFFTVLSNQFNGTICLIYAIWLIRGKDINYAMKTLKLVGTSAVGLTFLTIMGFLGPIYGYGMMFNGGNLWMHLILPLVSFLSFVVFERDVRLPFGYTFYTAIAPAAYSVGYLMNILINGMGGEYPHTNDFYGFLNWGFGVGIIIAIMTVIITWLIAICLYYAGGVYRKRKSSKLYR